MKFILLILFLYTTVNNAALTLIASKSAATIIKNDSSNTSSINLRENEERFLKFGNLFYLNSEISFKNILSPNNYYLDPHIYSPYSDDKYIDREKLLAESKVQLYKAMEMNFSMMKKNNLGTFGKILGGAVGISAVGLGIYHLIKYKDEYFK